jgi:hypothetical protein
MADAPPRPAALGRIRNKSTTNPQHAEREARVIGGMRLG